jgi:hypothetical protein
MSVLENQKGLKNHISLMVVRMQITEDEMKEMIIGEENTK